MAMMELKAHKEHKGHQALRALLVLQVHHVEQAFLHTQSRRPSARMRLFLNDFRSSFAHNSGNVSSQASSVAFLLRLDVPFSFERVCSHECFSIQCKCSDPHWSSRLIRHLE